MSMLTFLFRNGSHKSEEPEVGFVKEDAMMETLWETVKNGPREIHLEEEAKEAAQ